jgi:hypothetical protein
MKLTQKQKSYQKFVALRFGSLFAAVIALIWSGLFLALLNVSPQKTAAVVLLGLDVLCLGLAVFILAAKRPLARQSLPYFHSGRFWVKFYGVIAVEVVIIYVLIRLFQSMGIDTIALPMVVLIVGLHFYPLAYWNGNTLWYGTATVLSLSMLFLFLCVNPHAKVGSSGNDIWSVASAGVMVVSMIATSLVSTWQYVQRYR